MKLNNQQIINLFESLNKLYNDEDFKCDIYTSFILSKDRLELQKLYTAIQEERKKIYQKLGKYTEEGNILVPKENVEQLQIDINELYQIENDITLTIVNIKNLNGTISIKDVENLIPILET